MTAADTHFKPPQRRSTPNLSGYDCYSSGAMHSLFLPGQPLPELDEVQDGALYHVLMKDQSIGTVQRHGELWNWRSLTGGTSHKGPRSALEEWLAQVAPQRRPRSQ